MATLTLQIVSGLGTSTKTLTFAAADAQRILAAWQNVSRTPGGTQDQLASFLMAQNIQSYLAGLVIANESVSGVTPNFS